MRFSTIAILAALFWTGAIQAETESIELEKPISIGSTVLATDTVIALADGSVVAWGDGDQHPIVNDYGAKPSSLTDVEHIEFHRDFVSVIGKRDGSPSMATFKRGEDISNNAHIVPGLTVPLAFADDKTITATTSTGVAIYFAVKDEEETSLWIIGANAASLNDPKEIYRGAEPILALAVNFQGHLLAIVEQDEKPTIQFHHSQRGDKLLHVPTGMDKITSLALSSAELLYAAGTKDGKDGIYRLDAGFEDGKQIVNETEIELIDGAQKVVCCGKQAVAITKDAATRFALEK